MTTFELLAALRAREVRLWLEGDHLRYGGPKGALTPELRAELAARKGEIIALLRPAAGPPALVALHPGGAGRPFFCAHAIAGSVLCYADLAQRTGAAQPFYGLQAAGLEDDAPPRARVEDMAAAYIADVRSVQPEGPYRLGGWSFGGLVAFEMARQLRAQGQPVELLALIDTWAPLEVGEADDDDDVALVATFAFDLARRYGRTLPMTVDELRQIDPDQRLRVVLEQAHAANILPQHIDEPHIRRALAVFAANKQAMLRYCPPAEPRLQAGRVTLFRASQQQADSPADLALGWGALVAGPVEVQIISGDHYSLVNPPHVQELAQHLGARMP